MHVPEENKPNVLEPLKSPNAAGGKSSKAVGTSGPGLQHVGSSVLQRDAGMSPCREGQVDPCPGEGQLSKLFRQFILVLEMES